MIYFAWLCDICGSRYSTIYESIACCQSETIPICSDCGTRMVILLDDSEALSAINAGQAVATCPICKAGGIMEFVTHDESEAPPTIQAD